MSGPTGHAMADAGDWAQRIGRHRLPDGSIVVPPRIAAWLESKAGMTSERRIMLRGSDPLAYEVLTALRYAALQHGASANGRIIAVRQQVTQDLSMWMTTSEAAAQLGVTDRAIRQRIASGKLPAMRRGSRWLIYRDHLQASALAD